MVVRVPPVAALVGASLLAAACGQPSPADVGQAVSAARAVEEPWPALDERAAAEVASALTVVDPTYLPVIAARGLWELEQGRLGKDLLAVLDGLARPSRRDDGSAKVDSMGLTLALIVYGTLGRHGKVSDVEITILKALSAGPQATPVSVPVQADMKQ